MGFGSWVSNDLGLLALTVLVLGLIAYLVYAIVHPERL